jgi:hypothetical protein
MPSPAKKKRIAGSEAAALPLPTLLSQALVAWTIEFDNEFEHRVPHRTARYGKTPGATFAPWLASMAMWSNCMKFVDDEGVTVRELERRSRANALLNGLERWGYVKVAPDPADKRPKPPQADLVVRPKIAGRFAQQVWRSIEPEIEKRWEERFGAGEIDRLRKALAAVAGRIDLDLPEFLPIVGYGLFSNAWKYERRTAEPVEAASNSTVVLSVLLARVLLAFAIEFESGWELSMAICSNVLRVLDETGVRIRDLPQLTGISKEMVAVSTGYLERHGFAVLEPLPAAGGGKSIRLNEKGLIAQEASRRRLSEIEEHWKLRFGEPAVSELRQALERLVGEPGAVQSPLFRGLEPYSEGWRAKARQPDILPHFPVVSHRGGYPDGS